MKASVSLRADKAPVFRSPPRCNTGVKQSVCGGALGTFFTQTPAWYLKNPAQNDSVGAVRSVPSTLTRLSQDAAGRRWHHAFPGQREQMQCRNCSHTQLLRVS